MTQSIVTITAVDEIVTVDGNGVAQHVFTIRNDTDAPIKVGIQVLADEPADSAWFSVENPERELGENDADQVTVSVKVPGDLGAGRYTYRIRVYSIKQPGEAFTEGETVAFEVEGKAKPVVEKAPETKKCAWCIPVAIVVAVLVLAGGGYFAYTKFSTPDATIVVRDYSNWKLDKAINDVIKSGLTFDAEKLKSKWVDEKSVSKIVDQDPKPNETVAPKTAVAFVVGEDKRGFILTVQQAKVLKLANPQVFMQIKKKRARAIEPESE